MKPELKALLSEQEQIAEAVEEYRKTYAEILNMIRKHLPGVSFNETVGAARDPGSTSFRVAIMLGKIKIGGFWLSWNPGTEVNDASWYFSYEQGGLWDLSTEGGNLVKQVKAFVKDLNTAIGKDPAKAKARRALSAAARKERDEQMRKAYASGNFRYGTCGSARGGC